MNRPKLLVAGLCAAGAIGLGSTTASAESQIAPKTLEFLEATTISGYVEASYVYNVQQDVIGRNQQNHQDGVVPGDKNVGASGANQLRAFDDNVGFTMNAVKLVLEKPLGEGDWTAGYRVDLLYGQDAQQLTQAEGSGSPFFNEIDTDAMGMYIEQGYVAFRVPVGNGIDFKMGRFVALSGYEVIESPANLNFSRGLLFTWALPLAHTGLVGSYRFSDSVDAQVGIVNGGNSWIDDNTDPAMIGRLGFRNPSGTVSLGVSGYYGRTRTEDPAFAGTALETGEQWFVDGVLNIKPTEKVLLGLEALYGNQGQAEDDHKSDQWWGLAGYAKVQLSDKVSVAGRAEYLHDGRGFLFDDDRASFDPIHEADPAVWDIWEMTATVNFDLWKNMLLRFEARYDQASVSGLSSGDETAGFDDNAPFDPHNSQLTLSVDAIYSF